MGQKSGPVKKPAEQVVKEIRRATRRQFTAEEKIHIGTVKLRHYGKDWVQSRSISCRDGRSVPLRCRF